MACLQALHPWDIPCLHGCFKFVAYLPQFPSTLQLLWCRIIWRKRLCSIVGPIAKHAHGALAQPIASPIAVHGFSGEEALA